MFEIAIACDGDAYRAVYTVHFKRAVYVVHAFQKKSKKGIATTQADKKIVTERLKAAKKHYEETYGND